MKIAIIRKKYTFHGGSESFSSNFIVNLANNGHEIHIFAIEWQADNLHKNIHFYKVPAITFISFLRDFTFAISTYFILRKQKKHFDIIQTHDKTLYQDIYRAGDGCHIEWLKQRWKRTGLAGKIYILLNPFHWLILTLERSILNGHRFKKIIAISELVKKNIIGSYKVSPSDVEVIYNGVDIKKFHPENKKKFRSEIRQKYGLTEIDFVVLFVGSGFERKGLGYLIKAIDIIPESISLLIVGKGSPNKLKTSYRFHAVKIYKNVIPAKAGIQKKRLDSPVKLESNELVDSQSSEKIIFCGPQKDVYKYYAASDIFVFPTIYEPFGNVHLEALASGIPVITTKNSGAAEIIKDGEHGFVIDRPEDVNVLAERIKFFLHNEDKREAISKKARQLAEGFSYEIHIVKIEELYKSMIAR